MAVELRSRKFSQSPMLVCFRVFDYFVVARFSSPAFLKSKGIFNREKRAALREGVL
jgi:hypothetical protein